jgi:hypothetical protein
MSHSILNLTDILLISSAMGYGAAIARKSIEAFIWGGYLLYMRYYNV